MGVGTVIVYATLLLWNMKWACTTLQILTPRVQIVQILQIDEALVRATTVGSI